MLTVYHSTEFYIKKLSFCHKLGFSNPISLQPNAVNLRYFKLWILFDSVSELEHLRLWQRLNSFDYFKKKFSIKFFIKIIITWIINYLVSRYFYHIIIEICYNKQSYCHKLKFSNPNIFTTWWWCKPLMFKTLTIQRTKFIN